MAVHREGYKIPEKSVWSQRSCLYKLGVFCLVVASLAYALGHVAPFWIRQNSAGPIPAAGFGIWYVCRDNGGVCSTLPAEEGYLKVTRILEVLGFIGLVSSLIIVLIFNCRRNNRGSDVLLELVIIFSALVGFSGAMVYLGFTFKTVDSLDNIRYYWAFAVNVAGSGLALVSGIMIFFANRCADYSERSSVQSDSVSQQDYKPDYGEDGFINDGYPQQMDDPDNWAPSRAHGPYPDGLGRGYSGHPPEHVFIANDDPSRLYRDPSASRNDHKGDDEDPTSYNYVIAGHPSPSARHYSPADYPDQFHHHQQNGQSWVEGMEMTLVPVKGQPNLGGGPGDGGRALSPAHRLYLHQPAPYPQVVDPLGPFTLPRVVLRGYYDPSYAYPDYLMM